MFLTPPPTRFSFSLTPQSSSCGEDGRDTLSLQLAGDEVNVQARRVLNQILLDLASTAHARASARREKSTFPVAEKGSLSQLWLALSLRIPGATAAGRPKKFLPARTLNTRANQHLHLPTLDEKTCSYQFFVRCLPIRIRIPRSLVSEASSHHLYFSNLPFDFRLDHTPEIGSS